MDWSEKRRIVEIGLRNDLSNGELGRMLGEDGSRSVRRIKRIMSLEELGLSTEKAEGLEHWITHRPRGQSEREKCQLLIDWLQKRCDENTSES